MRSCCSCDHHNGDVISAMARKAGSLGLSVIATGIRDGLITPPALAAADNVQTDPVRGLAMPGVADLLKAGRGHKVR
jgi:hypothetical protein